MAASQAADTSSILVSRTMSFGSKIRQFRKRFSKYEPLITVHISKNALLHNVHIYQEAYPKAHIAPVLKSNAYGHGLVEVATALDRERLLFFALDSLHEAVVLRNAGIRTPLLIIGYTPVSNMVHARVKDVAFTITSLSQLAELADAGGAFRIHLKLDTGMHRQGILEHEWTDAQKILRAHPQLMLRGICSHFADADNPDEAFTQEQNAVWERAITAWRAHDANVVFHIAATAGARFAATATIIRLGIGLYGIDTAPNPLRTLKPVMRIETVLSAVKEIHAGDAVGYNATFRAEKATRIATIPMGYFEGIDRRLSNTGVVLVHDTPCLIVGRVSMNITTIDVSNSTNATRGDTAVVISDNSADANSVEKIAATAGAIPWEILVHIPAHLRRVLE